MATRRPCPGCKQVSRHRPADGICGECVRLIQDGHAFREYAAKPKDKELCKLTSLPYHYPYIHKGKPNESNDKFQKAFAVLAMALAELPPKLGWEKHKEAKPLVPATQLNDEIHRQDEVMLLPKGLPELLGAVYVAGRNLADDAYMEGHEDGQQLLTRLATGAITVDSFNDLAKQQGSSIRETDLEVVKMMNDDKLPAKVRKAAERLYRFHRHPR